MEFHDHDQGLAADLEALLKMTDNMFSDGYSLQLATMTGNATDGYVATLTLAVVA